MVAVVLAAVALFAVVQRDQRIITATNAFDENPDRTVRGTATAAAL